MTNYCTNVIEVTGDDAELLRMVDFVGSEEEEFDFHKILPNPAEWGASGNSILSTVTNDGKSIEFDTCWSPSIRVTIALSELFPTLKFTHRWEQCSDDFSGYAIIFKGKIIDIEDGDWDAFPITDHSWAHEDEDEEEQNE